MMALNGGDSPHPELQPARLRPQHPALHQVVVAAHLHPAQAVLVRAHPQHPAAHPALPVAVPAHHPLVHQLVVPPAVPPAHQQAQLVHLPVQQAARPVVRVQLKNLCQKQKHI